MRKMQISIPKEFFDKNQAKFLKAWKEEYPTDEGLEYLIDIDETTFEFENEDEDNIRLYLLSEEGVSVAAYPKGTPTFQIQIISWAVKKLNKFKTILETLT